MAGSYPPSAHLPQSLSDRPVASQFPEAKILSFSPKYLQLLLPCLATGGEGAKHPLQMQVESCFPFSFCIQALIQWKMHCAIKNKIVSV